MRSDMVESKGQSVETTCSGFSFGSGVLLQEVEETIVTMQPNFDEFKDLCTEMPLRFPRSLSAENLQAIEDEADINEAIDSLKEPGSISIEDLKKKLGL
jgi:hypothetical protein